MNKVYYARPYLKELVCKVVSVEKTDKAVLVRTDETIFYPECGGQPGDIGKLGEFIISDTQKAENGDSILYLEPDTAVEEGMELSLKLDWQHRYRYMVMHTAQHMLSGLLFSMFSIGTVSVHLGTKGVAIETDRAEIESGTVKQLITEANRKISENHKVIYREMSHKEAQSLGLRRSIKVEGDVRIVEIEDVDRIACGGVHVATTSELLAIICTGQEQIRGHVRLFFRCGEQAVNTLLEESSVISELTAMTGCAINELPGRVEKIQTELAETANKLSQTAVSVAKAEIKKNSENSICTLETGLDVSVFAKASEDYKDLALFVLSGKNWLIMLKGKFSDIDFNSIKCELGKTVAVRGGGKPPLYRGAFEKNLTSEEIQTAFRTFSESVRRN